MAIAGLVVAVRIGSSGGDESQNNDSDLGLSFKVHNFNLIMQINIAFNF